MDDQELKRLWQQQPLREPAISTGQVIAAMQNKTTEFRRTIASRDLRELIACVFVAVIFGFYFYFEKVPVVRVGWGIIIAWSFFAAGMMIYARRKNPPAAPGATVVESLRAELNSVRAQSHLLGSIFWWYLLPPGIGLLVATWGMHIHLHAKIPATLIFVGIYWFIYWLNQKARTLQLLPLEKQLESLLRSAETGAPLDDAHAKDLRPIVLSMAAAERVKPVEFGIGFGQLAYIGVPSFVAMWFFLTLGQTLDKVERPLNAVLAALVSRLFGWPNLPLLVPFVLAGVLFCWILKKGTNRAVGFSALGIHMARGQNLILWDEIKEVRPFKLLHIRSLWLIKDSGEKTIIPWTGLERRSELKAAVEASAPAGHPIRQYLSLLG